MFSKTTITDMYSSSCFNFKAVLPGFFPFHFHGKKFAFRADQHKQQGNTISRTLILCSQPRQPIDSSSSDDTDNVKPTTKDRSNDKLSSSSSFLRSLAIEVGRVGKDLKESLSPKHKGKGDWKDLVLMSLSFAVYVYMSQKLVCAYCAYMSSIHSAAAW